MSEKHNEISTLPELLKLIDVRGSVITADAMYCQKDTAKQLVKKGADYVLALKNNHKALYEELLLWINKEFDKKRLQTLQTIEKAHGRIETRTYALSTDVAWLEQKEAWVGLRSVIMVENVHQDKHNITTHQRRYYLSSLTDLQAISEYIRNHWSIKNSQHWVLDVVFSEDS